MNNKELENKINKAFTNSTPEVLDSVLANIDDAGNNIIDIRTRRKRSPVKSFVALAAAFAILIGVSVGTYDYIIPTASVSIDVNPSIEMQINSREHIVKCEANNADAEIILDGMDLRGTDIDVGVNALIGSMLKNGYLSELKNSVLITVTDKELQQRLSAEISDLLDASLGTSAVMSQTLEKDSTKTDLATQYGISQGKVALINEIIAADNTLTFDDLAKLSVNDLNLLASTRKTEQSSITSVGSASSKQYIGSDGAKAAAEKVYPGARFGDIELDYCNNTMAYEVELVHNGTEYELEIDAVSGKIIKTEKEDRDNDDDDKDDDKADDIDDRIEEEHEEKEDTSEAQEIEEAFSDVKLTAEQAVDKILEQENLTRDEIRKLKTEADLERREPVYKIEFETDSREYEFEVNANTGEIKRD